MLGCMQIRPGASAAVEAGPVAIGLGSGNLLLIRPWLFDLGLSLAEPTQ